MNRATFPVYLTVGHFRYAFERFQLCGHGLVNDTNAKDNSLGLEYLFAQMGFSSERGGS